MGATAGEIVAGGAAEERRWLFGAAVLDERSLELRVNGAPVELERKPLEVLLHLLRHAGEVVTKDELLAAVWPGRVLSDSALTSCTHKLREALADEQQDIIKTVHGYGYRLVAPVSVEAAATEAPAKFDFKAGEHLPARPLWSLVERLGTGGHGEAWLARHDKTRERRVYKFAADAGALVNLKREITIYRLLHDSLGERPDLVHLLDWNLEEPPYFVEYDYMEAGSLSSWAKAQGGLDRVPLDARLDLATQVADALAAAHSVGVLHKDLKPGNVLIAEEGGRPQIKLCDFGSGGVLDVHRLEQMGITRLGFTRTVGVQDVAGATPLYLAPEVVSGQPFTVKADIYALGVMLYQLAVGNFHKPLATGWELDVEDELLREDIAQTTEGHPERRLADASRLAQRLRSLDARRMALEAARRTKAETEEARVEVERVKARRKWVRLAIAASVTGVVVSVVLLLGALEARDAALRSEARAVREADAAKQVTAYMASLFDLASPEQSAGKAMEPRQLLDRGRQRLDTQLQDQPALRARVLASLGEMYRRIGLPKEALSALEEAVELQRQHVDDPQQSAQYLTELGRTYAATRQFGPAEKVFRESLSILESGVAPKDKKFAEALENLSATLGNQGKFAEAIESGERALALREQLTGRDSLEVGLLLPTLAMAYQHQGSWGEARRLSEEGVAILRVRAGPESADYLQILGRYGQVLLEQGQFLESELVLRSALDKIAPIFGSTSSTHATYLAYLARSLQRQGRLREAADLQQQIVQTHQRVVGAGTPQYARALAELGSTLVLRGRYEEGLARLQEAHQIQARHSAPGEAALERLRLEHGAALCLSGAVADGIRVLSAELGKDLASMFAEGLRGQRQLNLGICEMRRNAFAAAGEQLSAAGATWRLVGIPEQDWRYTELERQQSLLLAARGEPAAAAARLQGVLDAEKKRSGAGSPRVAQVKLELAANWWSLGRKPEAKRLTSEAEPAVRREFAAGSSELQTLERLRRNP